MSAWSKCKFCGEKLNEYELRKREERCDDCNVKAHVALEQRHAALKEAVKQHTHEVSPLIGLAKVHGFHVPMAERSTTTLDAMIALLAAEPPEGA